MINKNLTTHFNRMKFILERTIKIDIDVNTIVVVAYGSNEDEKASRGNKF